jgi:hypothetical protein
VLLHVPARAPAGTAESALAALAGAGIVPEGPLRVGMTIERANVRYYFPEDAAAARALSDRIGAATGTPVEARDFTSYRPQPTPGTVEVWLAGQGAPGAARAPATGPVQIADQIADQTLRDLEAIASEVARALSRSLGN